MQHYFSKAYWKSPQSYRSCAKAVGTEITATTMANAVRRNSQTDNSSYELYEIAPPPRTPLLNKLKQDYTKFSF
jgi:hypothetical protein